jgi:hypothetical protein
MSIVVRSLLGCDTFTGWVVSSFSGSQGFIFRLKQSKKNPAVHSPWTEPEDDSTMTLQNVRNYSTDTVSYTKQTWILSSAAMGTWNLTHLLVKMLMSERFRLTRKLSKSHNLLQIFSVPNVPTWPDPIQATFIPSTHFHLKLDTIYMQPICKQTKDADSTDLVHDDDDNLSAIWS